MQSIRYSKALRAKYSIEKGKNLQQGENNYKIRRVAFKKIVRLPKAEKPVNGVVLPVAGKPARQELAFRFVIN